MLNTYSLVNGKIEASDSSPIFWTRLVNPNVDEIENISTGKGLNPAKMFAALDSDEPSQFEAAEEATYLIIDIPYKNESGRFNTTPMLIAHSGGEAVTVCKDDSAVVKRFMSGTFAAGEICDKDGFTTRLLFAVSREYQQNLKEIDASRRAIEASIRAEPKMEDLLALHALENSLVYFITSLKSCNMVLETMKKSSVEKISKPNKEFFKKVFIENHQAVEMATIYTKILASTRELASSIIDYKLNKTMKWLTGATIVMTIPMIITGAYGMNVDLPFQAKAWAFGMIAIVTVGICGIVSIGMKKRKIF